MNSNTFGKKNVIVEIEFERIGEIDIMKEIFLAEITLTFAWEIDEIVETYDPKVHWNPNISIENTYGKPEIKSSFSVRNNGLKSTVIEKREIRGQFWERMEINNFPIDIQELSITLVSNCKINYATNNRIILKKRVINTFVEQQRWNLYRHVVTSDVPSYDIDTDNYYTLNKLMLFQKDTKKNSDQEFELNADEKDKTKIVFKLFCSRKPNYFYWNAYFLIFLITAASLSIFSIDPKLPQNRLQISATILLTSVSFKWVVNRSTPMVNYLTSLDAYSIVCIFYLICMVGWHGLVNVWDKDYAKEVDRWVLLGFGVVFVIIHICFITSFIICHIKAKNLAKEERRLISSGKSF